MSTQTINGAGIDIVLSSLVEVDVEASLTPLTTTQTRAEAPETFSTPGRLTSFWRDAIARDPSLRGAHVVVDVRLGDGSRRRIATVPIASDRPATSGLFETPTWSDDYNFLTPTAAARSVTFDVPTELVDPWRLIRGGYPVGGTAEVAIEWMEHTPDGTPVGRAIYTNRRVVLSGNLIGETVFGIVSGRTTTADAETVTLEVADPRDTENQLLPPWSVTKDAWPDAPDVSIGKAYPLLWGYWERLGTVRLDSGGPPRFLVCEGAAEVYQVYVNGIPYGPTHADYGYSIVKSVDERGNEATLVRFTVIATVWNDNDTVEVDVANATYRDPAGGLSTVTGDAPLPDVLDIIRDVLTRFTPTGIGIINEDMFAAARAKLGRRVPCRALVNASGAEGTRVLDWLEQGLLAESFPMIGMAWQDGQIGPIVTDLREPAVMDLVEGDAFGTRVPDGVSLSDASATFNDFRMRYAHGTVWTKQDTFEEIYRREAKVDASTSGLCAVAYATVGEKTRTYPPIDSDHIVDDDTASYTLEWLAEHLALPTLYLELSLSPAIYWFLRRGDNVTLTLPTVGMVTTRFFVERLAYEKGRVTLGLRTRLTPLGYGANMAAVNEAAS